MHEILAHEPGSDVNFDEVADRIILLVRDMTRGMRQGTIVREGTFGVISSETATALSMVLTELLSNAVEHGGSANSEAQVVVRSSRNDELLVTVEDEGAGLPAAGVVDGLGLSIVRTIVTQDLKGSFDIQNRAPAGVIVTLRLPLS